MSINLTDLELLIVDKVANTTSEEELLIYSKILSKLKNQYVDTVDTYADLPSAADNEGEISFVENLNRVFYSNGIEWKRITNEVPVDPSTLYHLGLPNLSGNPLYACAPYSGFDVIVDVVPKPAENTIFTDVVCVSAGLEHALGLKDNGTLWAWGNNCFGRLGDNCSAYEHLSPVAVCGGFTDWCTMSAGMSTSGAIRTNGTMWTWGSGGSGRLGNNSTYCRSSPVSVVGGFTDWCQISMSYSHGAAIRDDGTLWTWGSGGCYVLGIGNDSCRSSPVSVSGGYTDWCDVSAGTYATFAVRSNGTMWSWGFNAAGQLGIGLPNSYDTRSSPVEITVGSGTWTQVSAQGYGLGVWALKNNGTVWGWGQNCGSNIVGSASAWCSGYGYVISPEIVLGGFTDYICIGETTRNSVAALRSNGVVMAWGTNDAGHMGPDEDLSPTIYDLNSPRSSPTCIFNDYNDWCFVSQGGYYCMNTYLIRMKSQP